MSPDGPSESEILERGVALLKESLPASWQVQRVLDDQGDDSLADAVLNITGTQVGLRVVVEVKRSFTPKDVTAAVRQARLLKQVAGNVPVLVIAPWLSDRSRTLLTEAGINYLDLSGNARFASDYPTVFIYRETTATAPTRPQWTPSLKGLKAGRVVRLLADVQPPYGVLELAKYAGVTPGYVSRLLEAMEGEDLIERAPRGGVARVDWRELLKRRAESYAVFTSNSVRKFVCPNGPAYALELAGDQPMRGYKLALSGSFAAERVVSVAPPALLVLYADTEPSPLIQSAGLLPADAGANVVIATPYDAVAMEPRWPEKPPIPPRLPLVAASQLALDCLTGNGRMPQEGEALLDWMAEDESRWRLPSLADLPVPGAIK